ncbi:MAG: ABC transporter ATP-binding protein [Myxococcales bacterium]|nr:ABC transporter ATP-binding protein [Myxococcales bacterium]
MIETRHLTKDYEDLRAVDDVSLSIERGQCVGLLGLNGAGKTTLLRMLCGLLTPSEGDIRIDGLDAAEETLAVRGRIGFLPENPPLYPEMTVARFLRFAALLRGVPALGVEARVQETAQRCQLADRLGDRIETLSYGYRKRVGIAQAIVHQPALVILDEPIAGLDPRQIVEMRELVRSLRGEHTVLLSSHNLPEISQTCDKLLVMDRGRIIQQGSEHELAELLGRRRRILLQVRGERTRVKDTLARVSGVSGVQILGEADGVVEAEIESAADVREEAARAVIGAGLGLLTLSRKELDLEGVFLRLTGGREGQA